MKNALTAVVIVLVVLLSSCVMIDNHIENPPHPMKTDIGNQIDVQPTPEPKKITRVLIPDQELVYRNEAAGYQIAFPETWRGYYVITEYGSEEVCIGFYGKSKTGQIAFKHITGHDGLDLFWINNESCPDCPINEIGEVNGVEYFFIEHGGSFIGCLVSISIPDSTERQLARYEVDEIELELSAQDWEKAKSMYDTIEDVLKTFTPIS